MRPIGAGGGDVDGGTARTGTRTGRGGTSGGGALKLIQAGDLPYREGVSRSDGTGRDGTSTYLSSSLAVNVHPGMAAYPLNI